MRRVSLLCAILLPAAAFSQLAEPYNPPRGNCCLPAAAQTLADQLQDWNQLGRYHADNEALRAEPLDSHRVVFLGDSITDLWKLPQFFPDKPYVNRGISGQTTQQMLVRMFPDVINLQPAAMIVLAGTNDIARNTGPVTSKMIQDDIQAITELAQLHGIKVILCSVTPIADYGRVPQTPQRPPADIIKINNWMKAYAVKTGAIYADYYSALVDGKGFLKEGISMDGLHPNAMGYALMAPVAEAAIQKALAK
jgi:lysophospholipase L1-like esterase